MLSVEAIFELRKKRQLQSLYAGILFESALVYMSDWRSCLIEFEFVLLCYVPSLIFDIIVSYPVVDFTPVFMPVLLHL